MRLKKRLYLDIDGVLLTVKQTKPADHSAAFIEYILNNFDCYWLGGWEICSTPVSKEKFYIEALKAVLPYEKCIRLLPFSSGIIFTGSTNLCY